MSSKITLAQLNANNKTYGVDDYRKMVNYESGTNKGYVRFTKTSDGKLKLEKFNNKIDVPLSWRSNTSADHNKAVREKFLAAMEHDLKYMGDVGTTIRKMILAPKKPGEDVEAPGKALSRRDVKLILERFDGQFNTGTGRMCILKNFMESAKLACGFNGTDDEFARDYLKTGDIGVDHRFTEYITSKEGEDVEKLPQHQRMVKSEMEFRQLLFRLENLVDDAKMRLQVETSLKSVAKAAAEKGGNFGVQIAPDTEGKVRSALVKLLEKAGVGDVDLGFGKTNAALEMFIKTVVPIMVREGAENLKDFADMNNPESVASVLDADFNIDRIFSLAKEFIEGAKAAVADTENDPNPQDQKGFDGFVAAMKAQFAEQMKGINRLLVYNEARTVFTLSMDGGKTVNTNLAVEVGEMTPQFIKEAKLDCYTAKFLKSHFAKAASAVVEPKEGNFMEKARTVINNIKIAGQLNFGERIQMNPGETELSKIKLQAGCNVEGFLKEIGDRVARIVNEKRGGIPLYEKLMGQTLPAILNQKIRNAAESNGVARVHIDSAGFDEVETRIKRTVDAYCDFRDDKAEAIAEKSVAAFKRQLDRLLKKGNIDQQTYNTFLTDFQSRIKGAFKTAANRFFDRPPRSADVNAEDTYADSMTFLTNAFNEEKSALLAEMRERIAITVVTRGFGADVRNALIGEIENRIAECSAKLKENKLVPKFTVDTVTMNDVLKRLYYKVLAEQCEKSKIAGKYVTDGLVNKVKDAFYSAAKKLVNGANKLADVLDGEMKTMAGVASESLFNKSADRAKYKSELPKKEYDAMQASLQADLLVALQTKMDALKRMYLLAPEAYTKKDIDDFKAASEIFDHVGKDGAYTKDSVARIYSDILNDRFASVMAWIYNPTGPEGKSTLETDLIAGEKLRLAKNDADKAPDALKDAAASLPKNELHNIVAQAVKVVLEAAEKYAYSYASGDRTAFIKRINDEVRAIVDRHIESHAKFRAQVVREAKPYLEKYVDTLRTEKKDGVQVATDKLNEILDGISRQKEPPSAKGFALALDGMLNDLVNKRIDMKMEDFLAYSQKVSDAYEKCIPAFNEEIAARIGELKEAGATDEDIKFFEEKLAPVVRNKIETFLQKSIDSPRLGENAPVFGRLEAGSCIRAMKAAIEESDTAKHISLYSMLSDIGLKMLFGDIDTENATKTAVATWMKSPEVQKLAVEMRHAKMTIAAYGEDSPSQAVADAKAKVDEFMKDLKATIMGLKTAVLEDNFNKDQVAPAMSLFQIWLKQYNLPNLSVSLNEEGNCTLEEAAMNHFKKRVVEMQKKIADNPDTKEPLLSAAYLDDFTKYLNTIGRSAMFRSIEERMVNERIKEMLDRPENSDVYNYSHQYGDDSNAELRQNVTAQNLSDLQGKILNILDRTRRVMKGIVVSLEDMNRWGDVIEREFKNMIADESDSFAKFHRYARSRMTMMMSIDVNVVSGTGVVGNLVESALKDFFGGRDILNENVITPKFLASKKFSVIELVNYIKATAVNAVKESVENLKARAMKTVRPDDSLDPLPDVKALKEMVKEIAKSTVDAIASMNGKGGPHAASFKLVASELGVDLKKLKKAK